MRMPRVFYDLFCTNTWIDIDLCQASLKCTLAKKQKQVDAAIKSLRLQNRFFSSKVIGLSLVSHILTLEKPSYVLLCDGSQCVIIDLSSFTVIPKSLFEFIGSSAFTFVGYEMKATMAPSLGKYGLVCQKFLEAGPSFPETLSRLLSLRLGDHDVSGVFRTKGVKLSVVSIVEAYAAFDVGDMQMQSRAEDIMSSELESLNVAFRASAWTAYESPTLQENSQVFESSRLKIIND